MTHRKITLKAEQQQADMPSMDFGTLADQFIQESAYLPPQGDQSWREQDALRIFSGQGEDEVNPTEDMSTEVVQEEPLPEPGFDSPKVLGILLPVSLATFVMVLAVTFSMPEILTGGFWSGGKRAPDAAIAPAAIAQISVANATPFAPQQTSGSTRLRPSLVEDARPIARPVQTADVKASADHRQVAQAAPTIVAAAPAAEATTIRQAPQKPRAKRGRLPPIGEAYFASHTSGARKASADWTIEAAKWDEAAAKIRMRRENYQKSGDFAAAGSRARHSEFP